MAPSDAPAWAHEIVQARGRATFPSGRVCEVVCVDTRPGEALLASVSRWSSTPLVAGTSVTLYIPTPTGVLRLRGDLTGPAPARINASTQEVFRLAIDETRIDRINQRSHYRVEMPVKGEFVVLERAEELELIRELWGRPPRARDARLLLEERMDQAQTRRRPCVLRNISLGGARVSLESPPPLLGQALWLDLATGPGDRLRGLSAEVLESRPHRAAPPFDACIRVKFRQVPRRAEARLSQFITRLQMDLLKKGVKL